MIGLDSAVGHCSACGASIPPSSVLIEYETAGGQRACFAECPVCLEVVRPS